MTQRVQIPITGITTTSSYEEGNCYSLVNLRPKNGALHPVSPRKVVQELSQHYDIVFVHHNNDYENWIGIVKDSKHSVIYWKIRESPEEIGRVDFFINSIQQIGNSLSLISEETVYYMLYNGTEYLFIGGLPQVPSISFSTQMYDITRPFSDILPESVTTPTADQVLSWTKAMVYGCMDKLQNGYYSGGTWNKGLGYMLFDACFIRYAFRLYDGTITKHSPPILVFPSENIYGIKWVNYFWNMFTLINTSSSVRVDGYKVGMTYDFTLDGEWEQWKDIIKSVDIFMSPPVGISDIEKMRSDMNLSTFPNGDRPYNLIKEDIDDAEKSIANISTFYLLRSIDLGSQSSGFAEIIPTPSDNAQGTDTLVQQDVMPGDDFSNHKVGASNSYVYNERLHLSDITTTFFRGFPLKYNIWLLNYNGHSLVELSESEQVIIGVDLNVSGMVRTVYSEPSTIPLFRSPFRPFFSYPDSRAKGFSIYRKKKSSSNWYRVFHTNMEPHPLLGISYYLHNHRLSPIMDNENVPVTLPTVYESVTISEHNKIKVSALDNPLVFPNVNTYTAGDGKVLAMATNAMNVSDRNYGQYPLYVFTTQGIWTLNVGSGEVAYSTQTAPAYTEAPSTGIVGETPYGVVFTTQRGLLIINGQSVDFISPQIEQTPLVLNIEMSSHCENVVFPPEHRKFSDLLRELSSLIYNPYENELIINIKGTEQNYILNFNNHQFYQSTEKISILVGNAFPKLYVVNGTTLKDYASANNPLTHVSLILRPMQYDTPDIKRMERMILRAMLCGITNPQENKFSLVMSHYSNDGVNFLAAKGYPINEGNRRDFDMGLFSRIKSRQFLYVFSGLIDEKSQLSNIDTMFDKEYNNIKMR